MSQIGDMVSFRIGYDFLVGRLLKVIETDGEPWVKVQLERDWYTYRAVPYLTGEIFLCQHDLVQKYVGDHSELAL